MPQFDQFTFFTQVSWFLFLFFSFYFLFTYFFLPKICYNLKFKKKKIIANNIKKQQINFEKINIIIYLNSLNKNFFLTFNLFLDNIILINIFNKNNYSNYIIGNNFKKNIKIFLNNNDIFIKFLLN